MKKYITFALIALIAIMLILIAFPQSCTDKSEPLQRKSERSLIIDSIQKIITNSLIFTNNAKIRRFEDSIKTLKSKNEKLSISYYALRAKIKHLQTVKVESSGQTVNVPVIEYNASINSGTMCDSLLMYQDQELAIKDSIISVKDIQINALDKKAVTGEQALTDLIALNNEEKRQKEKAKRLNKKIPSIALISGLIGSVLTLFLIR